MKSNCAAVVVLLALVSVCKGAIPELKTTREAIILTKKAEVAAVGLFKPGTVATDDAVKVFKAACRRFNKQNGVEMAISMSDSILQRYDLTAKDTPAVVVFVNFDDGIGCLPDQSGVLCVYGCVVLCCRNGSPKAWS